MQCLKNWLLVDRIHRVLEFTQCDWIKEFIEFNTKKRMQANSNFEKKLVINANYGDRKKKNIKLVNSCNITRKYIRVSKPEIKTNNLRGKFNIQ